MVPLPGAGYDARMILAHRPVGVQLREWRERRHLSQLALAVEAEISTRHLSFVETGRSQPSRDMVLHLAELLDVPLRERNALLLGAGFAPTFSERSLDDPAMQPARAAIDLVLAGHEPYPAIVVDRHWTLVTGNAASRRLLAGLPAAHLTPPVNVLRLSLHPEALAPRIRNYAEWRAHLLGRVRRQVDASADPSLAALLQELAAYAAPTAAVDGGNGPTSDYGGVAVPLQLVTEAGVLSFISTTTIFGTPVDITLAELAVEAFFPADRATAEALRELARG